MDTKHNLPQQQELYEIVQKTLRDLGGTARATDVIDKVIEDMSLSEEQVSIMTKDGKTPLIYTTVCFVRYVLMKYGIIKPHSESGRGVWSLTDKGWNETVSNEKLRLWRNEQVKTKQWVSRNKKQKQKDTDIEENTDFEEEQDTKIKQVLLDYIKKMDETSFEVLCLKVLEKDRFVGKNTRKTKDGGYDGVGEIRISDIVSISVIFECKRYTDTNVSIADLLRFIAIGKSYERLIFFTTSDFTRTIKEYDEVKSEIKGGRLILINGDRLTDLMLEYKIGVSQSYTVNTEYLDGL